MKLVRPLIYFLCFLLFAHAAAAEVYVWTAPGGHAQYSDIAHPGSRLLPVDPGYSFYSVLKVFDGDTLLLQNGLKVRLLSINTPEVEGRHKTAEPGGEAAKIWLTELLAGKKVRLQMDLEKKDNYGRTLAHVFTKDDLHVNLELVKQGMATVNVHPPNLTYTQQLMQAQQQAEQRQSGLWQLEAYRPLPFDRITRHNYHGWKRVHGRVSQVREGRKYVYLAFSPHFSIRIEKQFLPLFPDLTELLGRDLEVRGWPSFRRGHFLMLIRHPSAIKLMR